MQDQGMGIAPENIEKIFQILSEQILAKIEAGLINPETELGIKKGRDNGVNKNLPSSAKKEQTEELNLNKKTEKKTGCCG